MIDGASDTATVIEVRAHDAPGPAVLGRLGVDRARGANVLSARVNTLGAEAVDVFYVTAADGSPLSPAAARELAAAVQDALA